MRHSWSPEEANAARYHAKLDGHYESWFLRANHPHRAQAFWIRYTIFAPRDGRSPTLGVLWFIFFDDDPKQVITRKSQHDWTLCACSRQGLEVRIADAILEPQRLEGALDDVSWSLNYEGDDPPLLLLPERLYAGSFPKAKALVARPMARFRGHLEIGDTRIDVDDWIGSQCHNWGARHTDRYAWGQVAGFDDAPDVFLECATARVRVGPFWTPWVTMVVLREGSNEWSITGLWTGARAESNVHTFSWSFRARRGDLSIRARFEAPPTAFVGLRYANPPGGTKICLNTKVARCEVELAHRERRRRFETTHRAAFERLVDDPPPGLEIVT